MDITQNPSLWVRFNSIHVEREDINRVNTIEKDINNLLEAIDETNVDQQMQTYFENPSLALDARSVREFLLLKLQKIEKRDQHFQNIYSAKKKEKTFFGIRSSLEFIHSGLVNMINTQKKRKCFFPKFTNAVQSRACAIFGKWCDIGYKNKQPRSSVNDTSNHDFHSNTHATIRSILRTQH